MDHPIQTDFLRWIIFLPLIGAIVNGLLGAKIQKSMGKNAISFIACAPVVIAFGLSVQAFYTLQGLKPEDRFLIDRLYTWINLGSLKVDMAFLVDPLSAVMILVVTGIGGLIHIYATGYMHDDKAFWRFFAYLNLFTAAMLTLVTGDSMLLMFVGWEGVGLCSYALIGFWYQDQNNARAGNKAFIVNRVGDFGFVLGIFLLFWTFDAQGHATLTFREMAKWASTLQGQMIWGMPVVTLATLFLFVGATGKSAQIPLYVWLPDAMAGPTPVSALIHAATMVTAGIYMMARCSILYALAPATLQFVAVVGGVTAVFAATIGLVQNDIKKVLAYSTISQLGYMFLAMGVAAFSAGIFHLMTHAFFKALLFLGSGAVIHSMHDEQDIRKMGGLKKYLPLTYRTFLIAAIAISGIPPFAGFFSKDEILWKAFSSDYGSVLLWLLGVFGAALTAFYMFRLVALTFEGEARFGHDTHPHEAPSWMTVPLMILAVLSVVGGFVGVPRSLFGGNAIEQWLDPIFASANSKLMISEHKIVWSEYALMAISVAVALAGIYAARTIYLRRIEIASSLVERYNKLYNLILNKYYVDEAYDAAIVNPIVTFSDKVLWKGFDVSIVDGIVNGTASLIAVTAQWARKIQSGVAQNYAIIFIGGIVFIITWLLLK